MPDRARETTPSPPPGLADQVRLDFPILERLIHGKPLVYLDNAATSLTPEPVVDALATFYRRFCANVHRGIHQLSSEATAQYEGARDRLARFIGAPCREAVIFQSGATAALNLVARGYVAPRLKAGDLIILSRMEHHANLVSWQIIARERGARLGFVELTDDGRLDLESLDRLLEQRPQVVSLTHVSNVLGGINPIREIADRVHAAGSILVVDGAQSVGHLSVDFQTLGADFLAFSGHKMLGPTGIGALIGRPELLEAMEPITGGGDMIVHVDWDSSTWNQLPYKLEAGTPPIAQAIGLGAAVRYLERIGLVGLQEHTLALTEACVAALQALPGIRVHGPSTGRLGPVAFSVEGVHPHDVATILDGEGIAIRAGHHCAQPLHGLLGVPATARASFYVHNRPDDIDRLCAGLEVVRQVFGHVR